MKNKTYLALAAALLALSACDKTSKTSSAGGGSSTQSVMTIRGGTH